MTFVEGVPPSKHFRCITQHYVLRSPITQPNIPEEQVAPGLLLSREGVATRGYLGTRLILEVRNSEIRSAQFGNSKCAIWKFEVCNFEFGSVQCVISKLVRPQTLT